MKKISSYLFLPLLVFVSSSLFAGFVPPKGQVGIGLTPHFMGGSKYYSDDGSVVDGQKFSDTGATLDLSAGLTESYMVKVSLPFRSLRQEGPGGSSDSTYNGIGDLVLHQRLQMFRSGSFLISGDAQLGVPTGADDRNDNLETGDGEWNVKPGFTAVWMPSFMPGYIQLDGAYNIRTREFSDEIHAGIQAGLFFWENAAGVFVEIRRQHSLRNRSSTVTAGSPLFANNQSFTSPGLGLFAKISEEAGAIFFYRGAMGAENIIAAPAFSLTLYYYFSLVE